MPQMNPMWWFSLFIMFVVVLITTNSLNYFYSKNSIKFINKNMNNNKNINWKW